MIGTLLWKDLLRFRRNWLTVVILLALPLSITAIIGVTFGPAVQRGQLPRIKLAIVDEDGDLLGSLLASSVGNEEAAKYFDPMFEDRTEAMRLLRDNRISAVVVIPLGFTAAFFQGDPTPALELIKNPAQQFMPAIVEELLQVVVESLNAISHNLTSEFPTLVEIFEQEGAPDAAKLAKVVTRVAHKFEQAEGYLFPPLINYDSQVQSDEDASERRNFNVFAYVLPGMAAMFLLFIADAAVHDLYQERKALTLMRYRTVRYHVFPFVVSKGLYALALLLVSAAILVIGGGAIFRIAWQQPLKTLALVASYCVFCVGFIGLLSSLIMKEERASLLNNVLIMLMAFAGGNVVAADGLPSAVRDTVSCWLPNYWFNQAMIRLQFNATETGWWSTSLGLAALGCFLLWIGSVQFARRLAASGTT